MGWSEMALSYVKKISCPLNSQLYLPFVVGGKQCGIISLDYLGPFKDNPAVFTVSNDQVELVQSLATPQQCSFALNHFFATLRDANVFSFTLPGWRNETYTVFSGGFKSDIMFDIERAAVPILGCKSYGVHMNGYVQKDGQLLLWVGKRSPTKGKYPGCYDNIVAGGISTGYGIWETLVKEADEEAGISVELMSAAKPVGAVCYTIVNQYGTSPEVEYVYDLELPAEFVPRNNDGEVAGFELMTVDQVKEVVVTDKFKHNCAGITIDFLIRHGLINPDDTPEYTEILNLLHSSHPF